MKRAAEEKNPTLTVRRQLRTRLGSPARHRRCLAGSLSDSRWFAALTALALLLPAAHVQAERIALVIGNDAYRNVPALHNARADAEAVAKALKDVGFKVTLKEDLSLQAMKVAWRAFKQRVSGGDDVVFYFAGHGVQLRGTNYLIPTDIEVQSEDQVTDDSLPLQRILDDLSDQKARFTLAIIDACRDNPFKGTGRGVGGRGLAMVPAATGQMVLYSAGSGQEALDRLSRNDPDPNGLFTRVLIKEMKKPGVSAGEMLANVRTQVVALAKSTVPPHEQVPALYDQTENLFYFVPPTDQGTSSEPSIASSRNLSAAAAAPSPSMSSPAEASGASAVALIPVSTLPEGTYPGAYESSSAPGIWHTTRVAVVRHPLKKGSPESAWSFSFGSPGGSDYGSAWLKFTSAENATLIPSTSGNSDAGRLENVGPPPRCPGLHKRLEGTAQGRISSGILEVRLDCGTSVTTLRVDLEHPQEGAPPAAGAAARHDPPATRLVAESGAAPSTSPTAALPLPAGQASGDSFAELLAGPVGPLRFNAGVGYVAPVGWSVSQDNGMAVMSRPMPESDTPCVALLLPPQPAQADMVAQAYTIANQLFAARFGPLTGDLGRDIRQSLYQGVSGKGWEYVELFGILGDERRRNDGRIVLARMGNQVAALAAVTKSGKCLGNRNYRENDNWALLFHSLRLPGYSEDSPLLQQQLLGQWESAGSTTFSSKTYAANGHFGRLDAHATYAESTRPGFVLQKTSSWEGDGTYEVQGDRLTSHPNTGQFAGRTITELFSIFRRANNRKPGGSEWVLQVVSRSDTPTQGMSGNGNFVYTLVKDQ